MKTRMNRLLIPVAMIALTASSGARAASVTWNGGSAANDFWSTGGAGGNWSGSAAPGSGDDAIFGDTDAAANSSTVNNIVDANRTIRSLRYAPTSSSNWQNTQINTGVTLTVNGTDGTRSFGLSAAIAGPQVTQVTISGGGTFAINSSANIRIGEGGSTLSNTGILDMSGLAVFTANTGTGSFIVGPQGTSAAAAPWTVKFAAASTLTTTALQLGGTTPATDTSTLKLGSGTQIINANTINLGSAPSGGNRGSGEISFNTTTGTLKIRTAADTVNGRADLNVANVTNVTGSLITGLFDVAGHAADLRLNNLNVGNRVLASANTGTLATSGTFSFDNGTLDVTAVSMGKRTNVNNANGVTAVLNIGGGIANIGSISMGQNSGTVGTGAASATLNLTGGNVTLAGNISRPASTGTVSSIINLDGASLNMAGFAIGGSDAITFNAKSGTLSNLGALNSGGTLTKSTSGTLILTGTNNYAGQTLVTAGTLLANGTNTGSGAFTIQSGATLGGSGSIAAAVTVDSGGKLAPGNSPGMLTLGSTLDISGALSNASPSMLFELGSTSDKVVLTSGILTIGSGLLNFDDFAFTPVTGFGPGVYTLFDTAQTISGTLGSSLTGTIGAFSATLSTANANQDVILTVVAVVPAPMALPAGLGLMALLAMRRRK